MSNLSEGFSPCIAVTMPPTYAHLSNVRKRGECTVGGKVGLGSCDRVRRGEACGLARILAIWQFPIATQFGSDPAPTESVYFILLASTTLLTSKSKRATDVLILLIIYLGTLLLSSFCRNKELEVVM